MDDQAEIPARGARRLRSATGAAIRVAPFWLKAPLYRLTPGGFGHYRKLKRYPNHAYDYMRDRHAVRRKHFGSSGLRPPNESGLVTRDYEDYDEYVVHQRQKLDEMLKSGDVFSNDVVFGMRLRFYRRFRHLIGLVPRDATIVCLGARQGTEVEVLRDLGFRNAYGIDLNPGPENSLVRPGDFHNLENETGSVDLLYSNSLDHAFDLDAFFRENTRVLKPSGLALYDVGGPYRLGEKAAFEATLWLRVEDVLIRALQHFDRVLRVESEPGWTWALLSSPRCAS